MTLLAGFALMPTLAIAAPPGPLGYWNLDESPASTGAVLADSSGNANPGTLITDTDGADKSVPGRIGQALTFDGTGDYVDIANQANFNFDQQSFTMAAWVKDVSGVGILASKGGGGSAGSNGWFIVMDETSLEVVFKNDGANAFFFDTPANLTLGDGNWHHVVAVMTFDTVTSGNNAAAFYVDGVNVGGTPTNNSVPALSNLTVKWGVRDDLGTLQNFYTGKIDDARIYNFALSPVYVAVGDSITAGSHDDIPSDGKGFEPILSDLLTASKGPVLIANVGVSGTTSADGAASIFATLATYPTAEHYLILYGSNDAIAPAVPSGLGLNPGNPGYNGSYKDSMQQIITAVLAAGKTPYLAKVPYATLSGIRHSAIREYNAVIDELVALNGISVKPPNFYRHFKTHQSELADGLHPTETGYQSMGKMWFKVLQFID